MIQLLQGDALSVLATLAPGSIQTVITSPPYYGLRDYGTASWIGGSPDCDHRESSESRTAKSKASSGLRGGLDVIHMSHTYRDTCGKCGAKRDDRQIGQEPIPDCLAWARREPPCGPGGCYVCALRAVFAAVWRVLREDGSVWLNLGDSYVGNTELGGNRHDSTSRNYGAKGIASGDLRSSGRRQGKRTAPGIPDKNLLLIPARVALALQSDGWIVRSDVIWSKPNCMPESVTDRPTRAHEYVYLLSKQARYYYDADAIREPAMLTGGGIIPTPDKAARAGITSNGTGATTLRGKESTTRNKRSVWTIATRPYAGAHFATFPEALVEIPLLASSSAQACETCGAAWGRVVEKGPPPPEPEHRNPAKRLEPGQAGNAGAGNMGFRASRLSGKEMNAWKAEHPDITTGFSPRCACAANTGAAASTVLDCFAGTGTVLRVAERFGRNAIGIELNPEYEELSDARTNGVQKELFT